MKNFTFKTIKPTGKWRAFESSEIIIKVDGKECGNISDSKPHTIHLRVIKTDINEDKNPNCIWKNIRLKKQSESLDEAKAFLKEHYNTIIKWNLHFFDTE